MSMSLAQRVEAVKADFNFGVEKRELLDPQTGTGWPVSQRQSPVCRERGQQRL